MQKFKFLLIPFFLLPISSTVSQDRSDDRRPLKMELENHLDDKIPRLNGPIEEHIQKLLPYKPLKEGNSVTEFPQQDPRERLFTVEKRNLTTWTTAMSLAIPTGVLVQGVMSWDWGKDKKKFGFGTEGFFDPNSYSGGADKTGHMMSHYIQKRFYTWLFYNLGHDLDDAQLFGILGAGLTGLMIELGDGISRYKFSWEDILMDSIGITLGWVLDQYPKLDELIGLRWEWFPSDNYLDKRQKDKFDFMSDYDGQKFYLTLKAKGIPLLREKWYTRYLTLDVGYFTRGYKPDHTRGKMRNQNNSQWWSYGMGINLGSLITDLAPNSKIAKVMGSITKYWVPPGIIYAGSSNLTGGKHQYK